MDIHTETTIKIVKRILTKILKLIMGKNQWNYCENTKCNRHTHFSLTKQIYN